MAKYKIKCGEMGSAAVWSIVNEDGVILASANGGMSGVMCLAAAEALNSGFIYDDWTSRLIDLLVNNSEPEA